MGAIATVNAAKTPKVVKEFKIISDGGHICRLTPWAARPPASTPSPTCASGGRHVQIGLMLGDHAAPAIPMSKVIAYELEIYGSHGMQAHNYPALLRMIEAGKLQPQKLIGRKIGLAEAAVALPQMNQFPGLGLQIINEFGR